jgi:peptidoglycan/LPS O-acetylase OafA/YrhL
MQIVTVVFDELLHVQRNRASRTAPEHTVFSFMSMFEYTPYVTVPGLPRLEPGMTVQALLREPNNWKSLVGWRDVKTGELAAPKPRWHLNRLLPLCVLLVLSLAIMASGAVKLASTELLLPLLFAAFCAVFSRLEYKAWRRAQADLRALQALGGPNDA